MPAKYSFSLPPDDTPHKFGGYDGVGMSYYVKPYGGCSAGWKGIIAIHRDSPFGNKNVVWCGEVAQTKLNQPIHMLGLTFQFTEISPRRLVGTVIMGIVEIPTYAPLVPGGEDINFTPGAAKPDVIEDQDHTLTYAIIAALSLILIGGILS